MPHPAWAALPATAVAVALVVGVLSYGGVAGPSSGDSAAANTYPCSHIGGGIWEESWNNSSGTGPTHLWVPMPGIWWATYNNSTGAAGNPDWGTPGTGAPNFGPGWTTINMTNDSATGESMMQYLCENPVNSSLPWHYDFATQTFVRNP